MTATSNLPDNYLGSIATAIAYSGGNIAQLELYEFLLDSSMVATSIEEDSFSLHDYRAGSSLLFLFPPYMQVLLMRLFMMEELNIYNSFSTSDYYKSVSNNLIKPTQLFNIFQNILGTSYGRYIYSSLVDNDIYNSLFKYFGISLPTNYIESDLLLIDKLRFIIKSFYRESLVTQDFIDISVSNDRYKASLYLANKFKYKEDTIQTITGVIERWSLDNSII